MQVKHAAPASADPIAQMNAPREMVQVAAGETKRATIAGKRDHGAPAEIFAAVVAPRLPVGNEDPQRQALSYGDAAVPKIVPEFVPDRSHNRLPIDAKSLWSARGNAAALFDCQYHAKSFAATSFLAWAAVDLRGLRRSFHANRSAGAWRRTQLTGSGLRESLHRRRSQSAAQTSKHRLGRWTSGPRSRRTSTPEADP